jgi:hypothetical protein
MIDVGKLKYPCVDLLCRETWPMFRAVIVRSFWVFICGTSLALAQDPPPLEGPASEPQPPKASASQTPEATRPPATKPASSAAAAPSPVRPMLVIPGVTVPSQRSGAATQPKISQPSRPSLSRTPPTNATAPPVARPSNAGSPFRPYAGAPVQSTPDASLRDPIPLTLEPLDDDPAPDEKREISPSPRGIRARAPASRPTEESENAPGVPRSAPWRMPGLLGRVLGQPPASPARDATRSGDASSRAKTKAKSEPETDAVVKRRIEQQIRTTLGDKVQSVEVRVSGRNVLVVARATRFWQKRGVRRSLETLPALAGFRARIDLAD